MKEITATSVGMSPTKVRRVVVVRDEAWEDGGGGANREEVVVGDPTVMLTFWPCSRWSPTVQMKKRELVELSTVLTPGPSTIPGSLLQLSYSSFVAISPTLWSHVSVQLNTAMPKNHNNKLTTKIYKYSYELGHKSQE
ncbi:hypothetical protein ACFX2C_026141 [Malus domestica]